MNMEHIYITDRNGKEKTISNVHSVAITDGLLIVTYEDYEYKINEEQFRMIDVERIFIN